MNILYISYDGMTDPLGQSQVLPYLSGLVKKGHRITLLSCEKPEKASSIPAMESYCNDQGITWHHIEYTKKPPVISTMKDVAQLKKAAAALQNDTPFDIVHCRSYIAAMAGLWMKKKYGTRFIFDMRGFWADERVDGGLWNKSNPVYARIYNYFKRKEKQFLQNADAVISLTHAAKHEIERWNINTAPITVIPCCVDTDLFDPNALDTEKLAALRKKADVPSDKMVLGYVGSLGTWYLLPEMLAFFKVWLRKHPDSVMLFVTQEPIQTIYEEAKKQGIAEQKLKIVSASRNEMPYYISLIDFGLFFIKKTFSKMASSPVKQGELMAMGVNVICNAGVGDSDYIINNYKSGVLVQEFNVAGYENAISKLHQSLTHPSEVRNGCYDYFDLEKGIGTYNELYDALR